MMTVMDVFIKLLWLSFHNVYVYQIIILYTLNIYNLLVSYTSIKQEKYK